MPDNQKMLIKWIFVSYEMCYFIILKCQYPITMFVDFKSTFWLFVLIFDLISICWNFTSITSFYLHWDNAPAALYPFNNPSGQLWLLRQFVIIVPHY